MAPSNVGNDAAGLRHGSLFRNGRDAHSSRVPECAGYPRHRHRSDRRVSFRPSYSLATFEMIEMDALKELFDRHAVLPCAVVSGDAQARFAVTRGRGTRSLEWDKEIRACVRGIVVRLAWPWV